VLRSKAAKLHLRDCLRVGDKPFHCERNGPCRELRMRFGGSSSEGLRCCWFTPKYAKDSGNLCEIEKHGQHERNDDVVVGASLKSSTKGFVQSTVSGWEVTVLAHSTASDRVGWIDHLGLQCVVFALLSGQATAGEKIVPLMAHSVVDTKHALANIVLQVLYYLVCQRIDDGLSLDTPLFHHTSMNGEAVVGGSLAIRTMKGCDHETASALLVKSVGSLSIG